MINNWYAQLIILEMADIHDQILGGPELRIDLYDQFQFSEN